MRQKLVQAGPDDAMLQDVAPRPTPRGAYTWLGNIAAALLIWVAMLLFIAFL